MIILNQISKSIYGYVFIIYGLTVSRMFRFYKCVFLLIKEVEYVVSFKVCKQMIWLKDFMEEIGKK